MLRSTESAIRIRLVLPDMRLSNHSEALGYPIASGVGVIALKADLARLQMLENGLQCRSDCSGYLPLAFLFFIFKITYLKLWQVPIDRPDINPGYEFIAAFIENHHEETVAG